MLGFYNRFWGNTNYRDPSQFFSPYHAFLQIFLVELLFLAICGYPFLLRDPQIAAEQ